MTAYGFRLFRVTLREGRKHADVPFTRTSDKTTWSYTTHLQEVLEGVIGQTVRGAPRAADEGGSDRTKPVLRVISVDRLGASILSTVRLGRRAAQDLAMGDPEDNEADVPISRANPSRMYRIALIPPKGDGAGVLAVEQIGATCPVAPFVSWSGWWSQKRASEHPPPDGSALRWWRLARTDLGDEGLLASFMATAEVDEIILTGATRSSSRLAGGNDIRIGVGVRTAGAKRRVKKQAEEWRDALREGHPVERLEAAKQVAALLGATEDDRDVAEVDFEDAVFVLRDEDGLVRRVSTSKLSDVFTYWIGNDVEPTNHAWRSSVRGAVERLAESAGLDLDWTSWPSGGS